jgi:hypothetical protein
VAQVSDVRQTLDSVDAITQKSVLEMHVDTSPVDECAPDDYACISTSLPSSGTLLPGIPASATFAACQRAADRRLYCVLNSFTSGNALRQPVSRWSDTGSYEALFDCSDPALALDTRKANPCTTISATLGGDIWLGGRDGSAYSIIKVVDVKQGAICPMGFGGVRMTKLTAETNGNLDFCMLRYATGRPVLVDVSSVDAKVGKRFKAPNISPGAGLLLLEDRKTVAFLPDRKDNAGNPVKLAAVDIASGKTDWALTGGETVQSASLMQVNCTTTACDNYVLATTSAGRLMAKRVDLPGSTSGSLVLGPALNVVSNPSCTSTTVTQQAWIRVSPQSGRIYLSDRCAERVRGFEVPQTGYTTGSAWTQAVSVSTLTSSSTSNPPNTLSVSPGIPIDLAKCLSAQCILTPDGGDPNTVGAYITNVTVELLTGKTGMTVFRIQGIPDCRFASPQPAICLGPDANSPDPNYAIETIGGQQYLRVDKLLPLEVLELFDENSTPTRDALALRIGPQYRARPDRGNTFDGFFGRTEDGVRFRDTFDLDFDIRELIGDATGTPTRCGYLNDGIGTNTRSPDNWDVIATVSERVPVAGTNNGSATLPGGILLNRDMLVNTSCENPTAGSGTRWSLYAYGLMQATCVTGNVVTNTTYQCRTSFVDLTSKLFDDLERARVLTACANVDGNPPTGGAGSGWPLSAATCSALAADWANARDKLNKCLDATQQPKNSSLNQNCQAFESQFTQYQNELNSAVVNGAVVGGLQTGDVANRLGELRARLKVFWHVYHDQMLPSVPAGGFVP